MKIIRWAFAALLLACGSVGFGQTNTFTKFAPATGVLKGSSATYVTSAAVAADIKGLWSGTCDATTFLRGDGSCAAPTGTGITFSMPAGFTVTGSPGSTISVTTALSGVLKGTGSAFTTAAAADIYGLWSGTCSATTFLQGNGACAQVSLTTEVTGILGVTNGGSGLNSATLGDLHYASATNTLAALAGNTTLTKKYLTQTGTGTVSAAPAWNTIASADVIAGWTGSCSSATFLRGDGACASAGGGGTPSSPTNSVQYNNAGAFGGSADFIWTPGSDTLNVGGASAGIIVPVTTASTGAALNIKGGAGGATNIGGALQLAGGVGGGTSGNGGAASITGGSSTSGAGGLVTLSGGTSSSGNGGAAQVVGGNAGISSGNAGNVTISGGTAGASSGGSVTITATPNGGAGTNGTITLNGGGVLLGSPTGGDPGAGAMNTAGDIKINNVSVCRSDGTNCPGSTASTSATITSTGCAANSGVTGYFAKSGNVSTLTITAFACTSNSTSFTFTGFPAAYQPTHQASCAALVEDNTVDGKVGSIVIAASSTISLTVASSSGGSWTAGGTKGFNNAITCSYPLN